MKSPPDSAACMCHTSSERFSTGGPRQPNQTWSIKNMTQKKQHRDTNRQELTGKNVFKHVMCSTQASPCLVQSLTCRNFKKLMQTGWTWAKLQFGNMCTTYRETHCMLPTWQQTLRGQRKWPRILKKREQLAFSSFCWLVKMSLMDDIKSFPLFAIKVKTDMNLFMCNMNQHLRGKDQTRGLETGQEVIKWTAHQGVCLYVSETQKERGSYTTSHYSCYPH